MQVVLRGSIDGPSTEPDESKAGPGCKEGRTTHLEKRLDGILLDMQVAYVHIHLSALLVRHYYSWIATCGYSYLLYSQKSAHKMYGRIKNYGIPYSLYSTVRSLMNEASLWIICMSTPLFPTKFKNLLERTYTHQAHVSFVKLIIDIYHFLPSIRT